MSRSLTNTFLAAAFAQSTTEGLHLLLTIDHTDLATPIRVVNNTETVSHGGNDFVPFPFEIALPDDIEDRIPDVELRIDNVDRQIVTAIRSLLTPPTVQLDIVLFSAPETVEVGPFSFTLREAQFDVLVVRGALRFENIQDMKFPKDSMDPNLYPGIFGGRPAGADDWPTPRGLRQVAEVPSPRAGPFRRYRRWRRVRR